MSELEMFEKTVQLTHMWVNDVARELGTDDKRKAFQGLRATLHLLRDRIPLGEAANLGSQLPILLAGFYYEGWKPESTPTKSRTKAAFLTDLREHLHHYSLDDSSIDPEQLARAVFKVISARITTGEVNQVRGILPDEVKELWLVPTNA
jgi:uncharacterized protein (DUF2267 family)